ncbi:hypothetical protein N7493_007609 [Penicillium malachiteum]|uniref:Uncharacterized protein n=1 Tax=Penicillium malachiteum TaxID=1324776 RepID=A0AAD6MUD2_9EURO|nr:hypothetical protein N7493_007609 [Penicillium malachiteum]
MTARAPSSKLEALPFELLGSIARERTDLPSLQSFAFASSVLYQAVQCAFSGNFNTVVKKFYAAFGLNLKEPIAARLYYAYKKLEATALINAWGENDAAVESQSAQFTPIDRPRDMTEIAELCYLHRRLLFFLEDFKENLPKPEWKSVNSWYNQVPFSLSFLEEHRLLRALCRLELHANIFGPMEEEPFSRNSLFDRKKAKFFNDWQSEGDEALGEAASLFLGKSHTGSMRR